MSCAPRIRVPLTMADGALTVAGHVMHRAAFAIVSASPLWVDPDQRGADLLIPGRTGLRALPRRDTSTKYPLAFMVDGRFDPVTSLPVTNEAEGLRNTLAWLRANVTGSVPFGDGSRSISLSKPAPAAGYLVGRAHVSLKMGARAGSLWRGILTLEVALGGLA